MKIIGGISKLTVNLSRIKCIKIIRHTIVFEYKMRYEYVFNPTTCEYERTEIVDTVEMEYDNYDLAKAYKEEFDEMWDEYLIENAGI